MRRHREHTEADIQYVMRAARCRYADADRAIVAEGGDVGLAVWRVRSCQIAAHDREQALLRRDYDRVRKLYG